jgi:Na+/proline symporter
MGNFSAWLFTGGAGLLYSTTGYGLLYFFLTQTCAYILGSLLTAKLWRRTRVQSPVEFTLARFGISTQLLLTLIYTGMYLAAAGLQLRALATVVHGTLAIPLVPAVLAIGAIVLFYTLTGGLWTVVVTDVLQFVILIAVVLCIAPLALGLLPGGLGDLLQGVELRIPPADGAAEHTESFLIAGFLSFTIGVASGQGPRFYCVPTEGDARKAGLLAGALFLTTPLLFSIPALVARAHYGAPAQLGELGWGPHPHEQVFFRIGQEVLTPRMVGVFLAAMFAASMSALDSVYNLVAAMLSRDVYLHLRPQASDRDQLRVGRLATGFCGVLVIGVALLLIGGGGDLFRNMTDIFFLTAPPLHVPVVLGLLYRRAPPAAGTLCILWSITVGCVTKYGLQWGSGPQTYATLGSSVVLFMSSPWWLPQRLGAARAARLADLFRRLDTPIDVDLEVQHQSQAAVEVFTLVGKLGLLMAAFMTLVLGYEQLTDPAPRPLRFLALLLVLALLAAGFLLGGWRRRTRA